MRKMFKAAASLVVGCAMLSTSAFAALTGEPVLSDDKSAVNVTVSGVGADKESTILVLKGDLPAMPATINDDDIVYIYQKTAAADGTATYSMPLGTRVGNEKAVTVFAGATDEVAAARLGSVTLASEPGRDFITAADTTKATFAKTVKIVNSRGAAIEIDGISMNETVVTLNTDTYKDAGKETAGYILAVVDSEGNAVENALVLYSGQRKKYVVLVPTTVTDYKLEVLSLADGTANSTFTYGCPSGKSTLAASEYSRINAYLKSGTKGLTTWTQIVAADVSGDGKIAAVDVSQIKAAIKKKAALAITNK